MNKPILGCTLVPMVDTLTKFEGNDDISLKKNHVIEIHENDKKITEINIFSIKSSI